jgi:hypothetical protein
MLVCPQQDTYYRYLSQTAMQSCGSYEELVLGLQTLLKYPQAALNIYEEYNPALVAELVAPLPALLEQLQALLALYPIDNLKQLATLCSKVQERSLY